MTTQELETVASYVKDHLPGWLEQSPAAVPSDYFRLGERLLRVEEAIKNQSVLMEKRFEAVDKRFEAVDKRFEDMNRRFEDMNRRFEDLIHQIDKRFESVDKRFEDLIHLMDKRFEQISKQVANNFGWTIAITSGSFVALGVLITVYRFLGSGG